MNVSRRIAGAALAAALCAGPALMLATPAAAAEDPVSTAVYTYTKINPAAPPSFGNSGVQTLATAVPYAAGQAEVAALIAALPCGISAQVDVTKVAVSELPPTITPPETWFKGRLITATHYDTAACVVVPEQPEPTVTVETTEATDCAAGVVITTVTTTTTGTAYDEASNTWVPTEPVVEATSSERPATAEECPEPVVPPAPPVDTPAAPVTPAAPAAYVPPVTGELAMTGTSTTSGVTISAPQTALLTVAAMALGGVLLFTPQLYRLRMLRRTEDQL